MSNTKSKPKLKKQHEPLPEQFSTIEEAAEFWDTHDSSKYDEHMGDVECVVDIKRRTYMVSLDHDLYRRVRSIAREKGVAAETLVNLWIEEKAS